MEKPLKEYMRKYMPKNKSFNYDLGVVGLGYVGLPLAVAFAKKFKENLQGPTSRKHC